MAERQVFVHIVLPGTAGFVKAGRFRVDGAGESARGRFAYARDYLERADAVALDPFELHLDAQVFETARMQGFFGVLRDSMPDAWGRRIIEQRLDSIPEEFDYLLESPDDRVGALGFGSKPEPPTPMRDFKSAQDLQRLQRFADAIMADEPLPPGEAHLRTLLEAGTSMGGARPKLTVEHDAALWLAKFECRNDAGAHPRVEHAMMSLARRCGLNVADTRVEPVGDRNVLLVRRFDRERAGAHDRRHRFVSAMTALQAEGGSTDRAQWSYLLLADAVRRCSARPAADLRELFARMCFNAAISNLDDHPRNHALLADGPAWRLSPAYDLTVSPAVSTERRDLALACGAGGRYANRQNLLSMPGRFLLEPDEAGKIFDDIVETVRHLWPAELQRAGVPARLRDRLAGAFLYDGLFYGRP